VTLQALRYRATAYILYCAAASVNKSVILDIHPTPVTVKDIFKTTSQQCYSFYAFTLHKMSCQDCFKGHIHPATPSGSITTIHGLPVYVAKPAGTPKGVIVYIPDIFGWKFVNNRLLADKYAANGGFLVYLPDFMAGSFPSSFIHKYISYTRCAIGT
jgi:hypothetical protein